MLLDGIFAAITTPFYSDGSLYLRKLEANVEHLTRSPLAGLLVLGSTGEAAHLDDQETISALEAASLAAAPHKSLIAGISRESVKSVLALADSAARFDYDAVLVRMPSYYLGQMQPLNLLTYFRAIADRSPLPVILYNIPQCVHADLPVELIAELAQHPNIIGIKDSSGNLDRLKQTIAATKNAPPRDVTVTSIFEYVTARSIKVATKMNAVEAESLVTIGGGTVSASAPILTAEAAGIKSRTKSVGFQVMTGAAPIVLDSLDAGATGAILAVADFAPQVASDIYNAWKGNDPALARIKQDLVTPVAKRVVAQLGIAGIKYACDFNGYHGGPPRLPLVPLTAKQKSEVEALLIEMRN